MTWDRLILALLAGLACWAVIIGLVINGLVWMVR